MTGNRRRVIYLVAAIAFLFATGGVTARFSPDARALLQRSEPRAETAPPVKETAVRVQPGALAVSTGVVEAVADGDSFVLKGGKRVRLIGIDAPEMGEPGADISKAYLEKLILGKQLRLEKDVSDVDRYGRLLRYAFVGELFVNGEMVARGYALARRYPPDEKYAWRLEQLEKEAAKLKRGLWAVGVFQRH